MYFILLLLFLFIIYILWSIHAIVVVWYMLNIQTHKYEYEAFAKLISKMIICKRIISCHFVKMHSMTCFGYSGYCIHCIFLNIYLPSRMKNLWNKFKYNLHISLLCIRYECNAMSFSVKPHWTGISECTVEIQR